MLRVSDFCRSPFSPSPSRRRCRPTATATATVSATTTNPVNDIVNEDDDDDTDDDIDTDTDVFVVPVNVQVMLSPSRRFASSQSQYPHESSIVRVPVEILKGLSLWEGEYACLECQWTGEEEEQPHIPPGKTDRRQRQRNQQKNSTVVVVRLELMNEEEENETTNTNTNCLISVPPIVLTNLGISPQTYWNQTYWNSTTTTNTIINNTTNHNHNNNNATRCTNIHHHQSNDDCDGNTDTETDDKSNDNNNNNNRNMFFQLRAIHDNDSDEDEDEDDYNNEDDNGPSVRSPLKSCGPTSLTSTSTCRTSSSTTTTNRRAGRGRNIRRRRKQIAGHVLLRPLGRPSQWPRFSVLKNQNQSTNSNQSQSKSQRANSDNENSNGNSNNSGHDNDNDDTWIFPSRSGIVLQESMLCEVRLNHNNNDDTTTTNTTTNYDNDNGNDNDNDNDTTTTTSNKNDKNKKNSNENDNKKKQKEKKKKQKRNQVDIINNNNNNNNNKVYYYEILQIRSLHERVVAPPGVRVGDDEHDPDLDHDNYQQQQQLVNNDDDEEEKDITESGSDWDSEVGEDADDSIFYITSSCTKFELDSHSISSLPYVRRLPPLALQHLPPSSPSSSSSLPSSSSLSSLPFRIDKDTNNYNHNHNHNNSKSIGRTSSGDDNDYDKDNHNNSTTATNSTTVNKKDTVSSPSPSPSPVVVSSSLSISKSMSEEIIPVTPRRLFAASSSSSSSSSATATATSPLLHAPVQQQQQQQQQQQREQKSSSSTMDTIPLYPHPDWTRVAEALIHAPRRKTSTSKSTSIFSPVTATTTTTARSTHLLHLIGTDQEHHLRTCVETAAHQIGMRCLSIRGLAAFHYEFRKQQPQPPITTTHNITVGSAMIEQQLAGMECAKEYIRVHRMEPCVLHFYDVDEELSSSGNSGSSDENNSNENEELRCHIEDRFWTKWIEIVTPTPTPPLTTTTTMMTGPAAVHDDGVSNQETNNHHDHDHAHHSTTLDYRYTPRILIVISTATPLQKGPWIERFIFPSISLSLPDERYIHSLWKNQDYCYPPYQHQQQQQQQQQRDDDSNNNSNNNNADAAAADDDDDCTSCVTKEMMALLRGRPAEEIVQLRRKMLATAIIDSTSNNKRQQTGCGSDNSLIAARPVEENDDNKKSFVRDTQTQTPTSYSYLEELCQELDSNRRKSSSDISHVSNVSWEDVGGLDHVRTEIMDAIELPLKYPRLFPPHVGRSGLLLFGPPGTGKTHVAKAVATECGLPFLSVKGPELLGSYVGESEANIRKIFHSARQAAAVNVPHAAAILFFDELDSLAPRRDGGGMNNGGGVMERVVASLLAELDGTHHNNNIDSGSGSGSGSSEPQGRVFVLGATNRPDLLDPSLLRPGRLDRLVYLGIPTERNERVRILASQLRKMNLDETEKDHDGNENGNGTTLSERMARLVVERLPPRLSGADMSKLSSAAMLHALRRLCQEAEQERKLLQQQQQQQDNTTDHTHTTTMMTVDQLLEKWGEEKCTTVITLEDLYEASKGISPSVSEQEMERYERLRIEHCTTTTTTTTTTKNSTTATSTIPAIL